MPATGASQMKSLCQRWGAASSVGAPAREQLNDNFIISAISVSQPVNTPSNCRQRGPVINSKPNVWYFFSLLIFLAQGSFSFVCLFIFFFTDIWMMINSICFYNLKRKCSTCLKTVSPPKQHLSSLWCPGACINLDQSWAPTIPCYSATKQRNKERKKKEERVGDFR